MIAFIDVHREAYGVEPISRALPIAPSTYHAHAAHTFEPIRRSAGLGAMLRFDRRFAASSWRISASMACASCGGR